MQTWLGSGQSTSSGSHKNARGVSVPWAFLFRQARFCPSQGAIVANPIVSELLQPNPILQATLCNFAEKQGGVSPTFWRNLDFRSPNLLKDHHLRQKRGSAKGLAEPPSWRKFGADEIPLAHGEPLPEPFHQDRP